MNEEIKTDNNCIIKAFENNPIAILYEDINNKKVYCFKASDIGKALKLTNIAVSIQRNKVFLIKVNIILQVLF